MTHSAVIIGAGLGGLSCAITLASKGWKITILERQLTPGGKLQRIQEKGYTFDRAPSTITMPHVYEDLFKTAGARLEDYTRLYEIEPRTRNVFADGSVVDMTRDSEKMKAQISIYSPSDALQYAGFLRETAEMYRVSEAYFLNRLPLSWRDKATLPMLRRLLRVRPATTMHGLLRRYFSHPNTLAMLGRYAAFIGSSPFQTPSIFAMLGHVEEQAGIYGAKGGNYSLVEGMVKLAQELGVEILLGTEAIRIHVKNGRAAGVETRDHFYETSTVIANGDLIGINQMLLTEDERPTMNNRKLNGYEPSLSGFMTLAGIPRQYPQLLHHTVFFPEHYGREFREIFVDRKVPQKPALYVCCSSVSEPGLAPVGCSNLFIMANAPYLTGTWHWGREKEAYGRRILSDLTDLGIKDTEHNDVLMHYTPQDIADDTLSYRGSLYGISSNSLKQTFLRPGNKSRDVQGLWYVGRSTNPGGGTPIVTLTGRLVGEYIAGFMI